MRPRGREERERERGERERERERGERERERERERGYDRQMKLLVRGKLTSGNAQLNTIS